MPDRSDGAIDFHSSAFCREVLDRAHPTRFSRERITYGADIFDSFRGQVWPANTNDEIAEGEWKLAGTRHIPLARLADGSRTYGKIIDNMLRPFCQRGWKSHFLTTYPDDRPVAFSIFDFDRHPPKGRREPLSVESEEWLEIDERFWEQVSAFHGLATRLDLDVIWVKSPGRWLIDGHDMPCRMFGLYAVIRHSPQKPSGLRGRLEALKRHIGLEVETSWDERNRNMRIPGQAFMNVCSVDPSMRSIVPIREEDASAGRFMEVYSENREAAIEVVLDSSVVGTVLQEWFSGQVEWSGTATELHKALEEWAGDKVTNRKGWPTQQTGSRIPFDSWHQTSARSAFRSSSTSARPARGDG